MSEKPQPAPAEIDPKKWTPEEKRRMKRLAKAAIRLWSMVLFGGGDVPAKALFKKDPDV